MSTIVARINGLSAYTQGRAIRSIKKSKETHDEFEKRTWKERAHYDDDGNCFIPGMAFKNCLANAAQFLSMKIPGEGKKTFTKSFERAIIVEGDAPLGVKIDDVVCQEVFVPSDGNRGGTTRVWKHFPIFEKWNAELTFTILDDRITEEIFKEHLMEAGKFIGIGTFRPQSNGYHGRFEVVDVKVKK